jgi:hypothetical protein
MNENQNLESADFPGPNGCGHPRLAILDVHMQWRDSGLVPYSVPNLKPSWLRLTLVRILGDSVHITQQRSYFVLKPHWLSKPLS